MCLYINDMHTINYNIPSKKEFEQFASSPGDIIGDVIGDVIDDGGYINFITGSASIPSTPFFPNTAKVYFSVSLTGIVMGNSVELSYSFTVRYGSLYLL